MKVDPSLIHRLFYPQVPAIFSAMVGKRVSAMPVVSYTSVSDSPPMVAVSSVPSHYTCRLVLDAGCFSLCILDRDHAGAVARLASVSGAKVEDKLADAGLEYSRGKKLKVPVIRGSVAELECSLVTKRRFGDHLLIVGEVRAARATEAFDGFWDFARYRPLLYTGWREGLTTLPGA
ncbi:MAG TPA: flavin reductase family protein [Nitrososphaerales archaeon]|nr:flavin reductase family protein [Nitrososphaerales archaeon]